MLGPLPSPVRDCFRVRRPSLQTEFKMVTCPGLARPQRQPLSPMYTAGDRQGCLRGWGLWCPIPFLLPWPPSPVAPQKGMYESPSPATSHHCLRQFLGNPSAHRHIGFQTFPTHSLPPCSRASALNEAFRIQGSGVLQQSWGGEG